MQEVYIHVGYGKTGTSAIQSALATHSQDLERSGVIYVDRNLVRGDLGGEGFATSDEFKRAMRGRGEAGKDFPERVARIFRNALAKPNVQKVVWSKEALLTNYLTVSQIAKHLHGDAKVYVVIYLRHHIDWLISAYQQWGVKHKVTRGRILSFSDFVESRRAQIDYPAMLEKWCEAVGKENIIARSYDTAGDVVTDFLNTCGIEIPSGWDPSKRTYSTPGQSVMSMFKVYNDQFDDVMSPQPLLGILNRAGVLGRDIHAVDARPIVFEGDFLTELDKTLQDQHSTLEQVYGLRLADSFRTPKMKPSATIDSANTDLIAMLTAVIVDLSSRVEGLEKKLVRKADESRTEKPSSAPNRAEKNPQRAERAERRLQRAKLSA